MVVAQLRAALSLKFIEMKKTVDFILKDFSLHPPLPRKKSTLKFYSWKVEINL